MKTTLNLDDDLLRSVKARAAERGETVTSIVEQALRQLLTEQDKPPYRVDLPVTVDEAPPSIDINSNAAIYDYLDRQEFPQFFQGPAPS